MAQIPTPTTYAELDALLADPDTGSNSDFAEQFEAMAAAPALDGSELSRAELLATAAQLRQVDGETDRALELLRDAAADGSATRLPVASQVAYVHLQAGRPDEARAAVADLRPKDVSALNGLLYAGEVFETLGDLEAAHRWYTRGVVLAERRGESFPGGLFLTARHRVRSAMGLDHDEYDEAADAFSELQGGAGAGH
jgi:tetratricopeptide (TPR) repeat protein